MIDFRAWPVRRARAYAAAYAAAAPSRVQWLVGEVAATRGTAAATKGPDGLAALWRWTCRRFDREGPTTLKLATPLPTDDPQAGPRPPWYDPDRPSPYLSDAALWLIDALGCHLAMLALRAHPEARWDVYRADNPLDAKQNRAVLVGIPGGPADPAMMVYGEVIDHMIHGERWRRDALSHLYRYLVDPRP